MAKRENDGTISLAQANAEQRKADATAAKAINATKRMAHEAIEQAFTPGANPRRVRKPLRAVAS